MAKLLDVRYALKYGSRHSLERGVHAREAIGSQKDDGNSASEMVLLDPMSSDVASGPDALCQQPESTCASPGHGVQPQYGAGGNRHHAVQFMTAQHRLDGMMQRMTDALATTQAMKAID